MIGLAEKLGHEYDLVGVVSGGLPVYVLSIEVDQSHAPNLFVDFRRICWSDCMSLTEKWGVEDKSKCVEIACNYSSMQRCVASRVHLSAEVEKVFGLFLSYLATDYNASILLLLCSPISRPTRAPNLMPLITHGSC